MLARAVPVKVVSEILGHSRIETTLNLYAHVTADMQAYATNLMGELLEDAP